MNAETLPLTISEVDRDAPAPSPFLPGTNIQYAWVLEKANWLVSNAIIQGECLISHLTPNAKGYIPISFGRAVKQRAHRIVFFVANPHADQSLFVLHKCDNRACIKLEHLFLGTAQDNTDDMIRKGRKVDDPLVGHRRKLATGKRIRPLYEAGLAPSVIAKRLYLSTSTVYSYIVGSNRNYLGDFDER